MAKKTPARKTTKPNEESDPLQPALRAFSEGDYPAARAIFRELENDSALSDSQRQMAAEYRAATWLERGALLTALGCILFFAFAVAFAVAKQP